MKHFLFVIFASLFLCGCAGTRLTERLWAVGCEEDYLMPSRNSGNVLYRSGNNFYLKCEKRTYQNHPGWYHILTPPISFRPNHFQYVSTDPQMAFVRISPDEVRWLRGNHIGSYRLVFQKGVQIQELPENAQMVESSMNIIPSSPDRLIIDGGQEIIDGQRIATRKGVGSYCLIPLMLPSLCIDIATHCCWPLNLIIGNVCLEREQNNHKEN